MREEYIQASPATLLAHYPAWYMCAELERFVSSQLFKDCERLAGEVDGKKKRMDEIKDQVIQANEQLKEVSRGKRTYLVLL